MNISHHQNKSYDAKVDQMPPEVKNIEMELGQYTVDQEGLYSVPELSSNTKGELALT